MLPELKPLEHEGQNHQADLLCVDPFGNRAALSEAGSCVAIHAERFGPLLSSLVIQPPLDVSDYGPYVALADWMEAIVNRAFTWFAGKSAWVLGHPLAFIVACAGTLLWAVTGPLFDYSDTWQLVVNTATTVITFLMLFVLQHSQNRDGVAIQAKLDTLILHSEGPNTLIRAEEKAEEELEKLRP